MSVKAQWFGVDFVKLGGPELRTLGKNSDHPHVHLHIQDRADVNAGSGQNPVFSGVGVRLSGMPFKNVTWPLTFRFTSLNTGRAAACKLLLSVTALSKPA